jgi:hypothetical protein
MRASEGASGDRTFGATRTSSRIQSLLAVAIKSGAKVSIGCELSDIEAADLAKKYTLAAAVEAIASRRNLHGERAQADADNLAVAEAIIHNPSVSPSDMEVVAIVDIRNKVDGQSAEREEARSAGALEAQRLAAIVAEIEEWSDKTRKYLYRAATLYHECNRAMLRCRLPSESLDVAVRELNGLFTRSLEEFDQALRHRRKGERRRTTR